MIEGNEYVKFINEIFYFLEFEFKLCKYNEVINGSVFYDVEYRDDKKAISISYENLDNILLVIIFLLEDDKLPNYDDDSKTLHLNKLTGEIIPYLDKYEIELNEEYFNKFKIENKFDAELLKKAKDLRLCLLHLTEF